MSEWGTKVWTRLDGHESRLDAADAAVRTLQQAPEYPPEARRRDEEITRSIERSSVQWLAVNLGNLEGVTTPAVPAVPAARIFDTGEHTFGSSYPSGGEALDGFPTVANRETVLMQGHDEYEFVWDNTGAKMLVYQLGMEVVATTDLSGLSARPYMVLGTSAAVAEVPASYAVASQRYRLYRALGRVTVLRVEIEVGTEIAKHASNYWDFKVYHRRTVNDALESTGDRIATLSTSTYKLGAGDPRLIYENETGLVLDNDDRLELTAAETGQATALDGATVWLKVRRQVR